ncbi:ATP-binding protein [Citrobacter freundii]|nr:ATP-binding protein [Citrobacter freundii]QLD38388.1 AAA family ATPase [Citrobacter freundii]
MNGEQVINKITDLVDVITKLEGLFYSLNEWLKIEKDAFNRQNLLDDYKSQKQNKEGELKKGAENITSLNKSLEDALEYFPELASSSINNDILNDMFMYIEPHLKYDKIKFKVDLSSGNKGIYIQAHSDENSESTTPVYYLSEAQINILSICIFLADHARKIDCGINAIIIDDPVQSMDDLNSYALIDLCKLFARRFGKQVIITTHNRSFFNLFKEKLPEFRYATKYISL